ncbi:hypothetical protein DSM3645_03178 [Blastopirellula marina DSM 3645]|uniref:Uncharacterized protein n=1 Tax=Blastopirellula marina DSM 3645 TaxID=314230 RepID=A3ZVU9_9BACT|nr:hypothetical protein DSM3645_03178 [Blastopirellula marina DSM 3645]
MMASCTNAIPAEFVTRWRAAPLIQASRIAVHVDSSQSAGIDG